MLELAYDFKKMGRGNDEILRARTSGIDDHGVIVKNLRPSYILEKHGQLIIHNFQDSRTLSVSVEVSLTLKG